MSSSTLSDVVRDARHHLADIHVPDAVREFSFDDLPVSVPHIDVPVDQIVAAAADAASTAAEAASSATSRLARWVRREPRLAALVLAAIAVVAVTVAVRRRRRPITISARDSSDLSRLSAA